MDKLTHVFSVEVYGQVTHLFSVEVYGQVNPRIFCRGLWTSLLTYFLESIWSSFFSRQVFVLTRGISLQIWFRMERFSNKK